MRASDHFGCAGSLIGVHLLWSPLWLLPLPVLLVSHHHMLWCKMDNFVQHFKSIRWSFIHYKFCQTPAKSFTRTEQWMRTRCGGRHCRVFVTLHQWDQNTQTDKRTIILITQNKTGDNFRVNSKHTKVQKNHYFNQAIQRCDNFRVNSKQKGAK